MASFSKASLWEGLPRKLEKELFKTLLKRPGISIRRIVSQGQTTDWMTQDFEEWVVLFSGRAKILFAKGMRTRVMKPGDYVFIPAGCRHKVAWTDPKKKSIWLAVHYKR